VAFDVCLGGYSRIDSRSAVGYLQKMKSPFPGSKTRSARVNIIGRRKKGKKPSARIRTGQGQNMMCVTSIPFGGSPPKYKRVAETSPPDIVKSAMKRLSRVSPKISNDV